MKGKIFMGALASLSLFLIASACDIGLGGAVDTEIPTGTISSPGVNAVIRDAFAIKGTWKDDGSVGQVTVALSNTNTKTTRTYNAKVAADGTWICAVDPADSAQPLVDGTYLATVTLYDNGGHTNTVTQSYIIDNTPPVVILSYLKSKDDSATEIKTYGKLFTLSGKAADDNNINRIDVKVYQDEGCSTELRTITKLNVPAAIEQDVASFGTEEYSAIYGENSTNSQVRYCKVFAYDDAQRYPADGSAQTDSDKLGNCQTSYYFQTTIEKLGYDKYKTNDLYAMFNGTYSNGSQDSSRAVLTSDEISTVKKTLTETAVKVGTFALNPKNNPTFTVIGLNQALPEGETMFDSATSEPKTLYTVTNGDTQSGIPLTITLTPGRDNYAIENSSIKMYLQECSVTGEVISTAEKITIPNENNSTSVKTKPISTQNFAGLKTDKYYKVCVEGTDTKENAVEPDIDGIYAFYLAPLNGVIELNVSGSPWGQDAVNFEPITSYISSASGANTDYKKYKVSLNYSYTGEQELNAYKKESNGSFVKINTSELEKGTDKTYQILIDASDLTSDAVTMTYKLQNEVSYSRERSVTIYRDNKLPEVLNSGENLITFPSATETANSSFKFEGKATDEGSGISKVFVKLYQAKTENGEEVEDTAKSVIKEASGTTNWTLQVIKGDSAFTDILADEGKKKAEIWAVDKVGLKSNPVTIDWIYKATKPTLRLTGYQAAGGTDVGLQKDLSSSAADFAVGKIFTLKGLASDAFGVKKITVVQTNKKTAETKTYTTDENGGIEHTEQSDSWIWSIPNLPYGGITANDTVKYEYKFTVTDKADLPTVFQILTVTIDNTPPAVKTVLLPGSFGKESLAAGDHVFKGTAADDDNGLGLKSVLYAIKETGVEPVSSDWKTASLNEGNWQFTQTCGTESGNLAEGKYTLHVKAVDLAGNESTVTEKRDFCVDFADPVIDEVKVLYGNSSSTVNEGNSIIINKNNSADKFQLQVKASDTIGIKSIKAKYGTEPKELTYDSDKSAWVSGDFENQGTYNFEIVVEDKSGNGETGSEAIPGKTDSRAFTVLFDKVEPSFTLVSVKGQPIASTDDNSSVWYNSQTVSLEIEANDDATGTEDKGSGIDIIECVGLPKGSEPTASTEWTALTKKTGKNTDESQRTYYKGSVIFPETAGRESRLYIRATDKAENASLFKTKSGTSDISYIIFNIDMSAPDLKSSFYQVEGGSLKVSGGTVYLTENKKITVYGSCKDDDSLVKEITSDLTGVTFSYYKALKDDQGKEIDLTSSNINDFFAESNKAAELAERRYWKAEFTPTLPDNNSVDFNITATNGAGASTKIAPVFSMLKDREEPVIDRKNVTFTITGNEGNDEPVYMKGNKGETGEKYYVNNTRDKFTLHGIATDNVGLDSVELKAKDSSGNEITIDSKKSGSASNWTFYDIDLSKTKAVGETAGVSLTGGVTLYVELTDLAGNKNINANRKFTVVFDTKAPRGKHLADGKGKDIYFRIGNTNNDDILETDSLWDAALDVNAGSKYSAETYGNTKNIEIRGLFDDGDILKTDGSTYADNEKPDVSGLKTIYYKVYKKSEHKADFDKVTGKTYEELIATEANKTLASSIKTSYTGKITPDSSITEKRVFYTDTSKTSAGQTLGDKLTSEGYITDKEKHWAKIKSNFDQTITGFDEENNYLVLVAEDNVGNIAVDLVLLNEDATTHKGDSYNNFSLNVDTNPPVSGDFVSSATYTNATTGTQTTKLRNGDIVITGTVKDVLPNTTVPATTVSELKSLIVKVGNTDNKIEFKIKEEEENSTVVKNYYVNDVKQAVVPAADENLSSYTNILTTNKNSSDNLAVRNWKATIPGTYFAGLSGNVVISVIAKDNAGNEKEETAANVIVDSVKPAVTLNLTENTTVNGKQTLKGTISDSYLTEDPEPGTLELFYITKAGTATAPDSIDSAAAATANAGTDWRKYGTIKHGSSFEFKDIDTAKLILSGGTDSTTYIPDQKKVYFTVKATDKAGNIGFSTPKSFIVDQDTDRPEITFRNLTLANETTSGTTTTVTVMGKDDKAVWARTDELWGIVNDDDGVESVYVMRIDNDSETPLATDSDWGTTSVYKNGTWSYKVPQNGYGVLYFKVIDKVGGVFISKAGLNSTTGIDISTPKINDETNFYGYREGKGVTAGEGNNVYNSTVYVRVDTIIPEIKKVYYTLDTDKANEITDENITSNLGDNPSDGWKKLDDLGSEYLGGSEKPYLYLIYHSFDDNGINSTSEILSKDDKSLSAEKLKEKKDDKNCYRLVKFDLSKKGADNKYVLSDGENNLVLQVKDQAGSKSLETKKAVNIDNAAPEVTPDKQNGEDVYGSLAVSYSGKSRDEHKQNIEKLYFAVTKENKKPAASAFTEISEYTSTSKWSIEFDDGTNDDTQASTVYHAKTLNKYLDELYETDSNGKKPSELDENKTLYVWVYAEDSLGNSGFSTVESVSLNVIPRADKPSVKIEYPSTSSTVGGTIRVSGYSEIKADKVAKIWLQIDPDYNGTTFASDWKTKLETLNGSQAVGYTISTSTGVDSIAAGILATGSVQSWSLPINTLGEFTQIDTGTTDEQGKKIYRNRVVAVRAYAVSDKNKILSSEDLVFFTVDPNRPVFSGEKTNTDLMLVSKDGKKSKTYVENDWISGEWYLTGSIKHGAGIRTLTMTPAGRSGTSLVTEGAPQTVTDVTLTKRDSDTYNSGNTAYNWDFKIPVGAAEGVGTQEFTLTGIDNGNGQNNDLTIKLRYDNNAPTDFVAKTSSGTIAANGNEFKQSNKKFALNGTIKEGDGESGLERIAFYFTRTIGEKTYFIDPMITKDKGPSVTENRYRNNYVDVSGIEPGVDGLYWRKVSNASIANKNELTVSVPDNVRIGSICKINNVVYKITDIDSAKTKVTLNGNLANASELDVYFALAQVIDNTSTETVKLTDYTYTYDSTKNDKEDLMSNGDGDQMPEGISGSGYNYEWEATINSKNIYDGPVKVHFVYYDKAGNSASVSYDGEFCNNPPRIASVTVASDYDGNGEAGNADNEKKTRYIGSDLKKAYSKAEAATSETVILSSNFTTSGSSFMKLKGASKIDVEIVGGNGNLYYSYNVGTTLGADSNTIKGNYETTIGAGNQDNDDYEKTENGKNIVKDDAEFITAHTRTIAISKTDFDNYHSKGKIENGDTWFQYTIWDETDGKTKFTDSQNVTIQLLLDVQVHDDIAPNVVISPFFWTSGDNNSLYQNSTANGHIELENDWKSSAGYSSSATSGEFDGDPKVSGKIVIRGSAWDNTIIKELWARVYTESETTKTDAMTLTNPYDATTNENLAGYKKIAVYEKESDAENASMVWKYVSGTNTAATITTDGWTFAIDKDSNGKYKGSIDEDGHLVYWTLELDTEKIGTVCASDVNVSIRAVDTNGKETSETDSTGTTAEADTSNKPAYQMDVVPYITSVTRDSTRYNENRARSGAVALLRGEGSNKISGFNLGNLTNSSISIVPNKNGSGTGTEMTSPALADSDRSITFTVPETAETGYLHVVVNGVAALNNMNGYVDYNTETNAKAFDHNTLTDDRYVHIWRVTNKDTFKGSKNAVYPSMASGSDGTLYASFSNYGQAKVYYTKTFTGGAEVKVSKYSGCASNAAVDSIQTSGDAKDIATIFFGFDPPEEASIVVGPNDEVNVIYAANHHGGQDSHWNGFSASDAGGLFIYDTHATDTNIQSSTKRAKMYRSELYTYDNELNQFRNARITRTNDYIYAAYYDRLTGAIKTCIINDSTSGTEQRPDTKAVALPWITLDGSYDALDNATASNASMTFKVYEVEKANFKDATSYPGYNQKGVTYNGTHFGFAPITGLELYNYGTWYFTTSDISPWIPFLNTNYEGGLSRTSGTGESVSITTNPSGYPVVFYMDATTGQPRIARASSVYPNTTSDWHVQGVFASSDVNYRTASDYMTCKVDTDGYLHIAFQNTKGQLVYAKSTNNPSDGTTAYTFGASQVIDDSGMWIDITMNGTTPYISYLSRVNSYEGMKLAFWDSTFDENNDGVAEGGWETMTAAMDQKVTNVRTCIASNAKAYDGNSYTAAIGFCPGLDYRAAFYVGQ